MSAEKPGKQQWVPVIAAFITAAAVVVAAYIGADARRQAEALKVENESLKGKLVAIQEELRLLKERQPGTGTAQQRPSSPRIAQEEDKPSEISSLSAPDKASLGRQKESPSPTTQTEDRKIPSRNADPIASGSATLIQVTDLTGNSFVLQEPEVSYPSGFGPSRKKGIRVRRGTTESFLEWARMRSLAFAGRKEKNAKGKEVWQYDVTIELTDGTATVVSLVDDWNMAYMGGGGPGLLFGKTELGDSSVKFSEIRQMKILQAANAPPAQ